MFLRIVSASLLAPPLIYLILHGSLFPFFMLVLLTSVGLVHEWQRMRAAFSTWRFTSYFLGTSLLVAASYPGMEDLLGAVLAMLLLAFFADGVYRWHPGGAVVHEIGYRFMGVVYCALPLGLLVRIRNLEQGGALICFLLFVLWATDIGGYVFGRLLGNKKLVPKLSPGKTWAGFWGGTLLGMTVAVGAALYFSLPFSVGWALFMGLVLSLCGQTGDLAESMLKRETGVKDSGRLIPGHGGLMDRLDSLLFAAPVYYLFLFPPNPAVG